MEKILENLALFASILLASFVPKILDILEKRKSSKKFIRNVDVNVDVKNILTEIRVHLKTNRCSTVDYHNGIESINDMPLNFGSMTAESTDENTKELMYSYQSVPVNPISRMLQELNTIKDGYLKVDDTYHDLSTIRTMRAYGINCTYNFRLGTTISSGVLVLAWNEENPVLSKEQIEWVMTCVYRINLHRTKIKH
jgi:hypothetical protein